MKRTISLTYSYSFDTQRANSTVVFTCPEIASKCAADLSEAVEGPHYYGIQSVLLTGLTYEDFRP